MPFLTRPQVLGALAYARDRPEEMGRRSGESEVTASLSKCTPLIHRAGGEPSAASGCRGCR